jgi:outer membrane murein-binding lipoprotein Lpp
MKPKKIKSMILCLALLFTMAGCADTTANSNVITDSQADEDTLSDKQNTHTDTENAIRTETQADSETDTDANAETGNLDTEEQSAQEIMAYIEGYDGQTVTYDEVEWVDVPSDRATELGLSEYEDAGFCVYNETEELSELPLAAACVCTIFDWSNNYEYREVSAEELIEVLKEREGTRIPYTLTIQDHEVVAITECYVP